MNPVLDAAKDSGTETLILYSVIASIVVAFLARIAWGLIKNRVKTVESTQSKLVDKLESEIDDRKLVDRRFHDQQTLLTQRLENNENRIDTINSQLKAGVDRFAQQDAKIGAVLDTSVSKAEFTKAQDVHDKQHDKLDAQLAKLGEGQTEVVAQVRELTASTKKGFDTLTKLVASRMPLVGDSESD